jgi:hypothetical protein
VQRGGRNRVFRSDREVILVDTIKKHERKNWFYSYNLMFELDLSIQAKMIYTYLCRCADNEGQSFPSLNDIAKKCSIKTRQTVVNGIKELEEARMLSKERRTRANKSNTSTLYTIYHAPYDVAVVAPSPLPPEEEVPSPPSDPTLSTEKTTPVYEEDTPCLCGRQALSTEKTPLVYEEDTPCLCSRHPEGLPSKGLPSEGLPIEGLREETRTRGAVARGSPQKGDEEDGTKVVQVAEYVSMTAAEYDKLLSSYGATHAALMISKLNNYKGSTGKRYKNDYRAILSWVADEILKNHQKHAAHIPRSSLALIGELYEEAVASGKNGGP